MRKIMLLAVVVLAMMLFTSQIFAASPVEINDIQDFVDNSITDEANKIIELKPGVYELKTQLDFYVVSMFDLLLINENNTQFTLIKARDRKSVV